MAPDEPPAFSSGNRGVDTGGGRGHFPAPGAVNRSAYRRDPASSRLEALSVFGRPAGETFADGVSRVAYSEADIAGRQYVMG